jgi:hypothetical protein
MIGSAGEGLRFPVMQDFAATTCWSRSRKSGNRLSEKIMFKQRDEIIIDSI